MDCFKVVELSNSEMMVTNGGGFFFDVGVWLYDAFNSKGKSDPAIEVGYNFIILNK